MSDDSYIKLFYKKHSIVHYPKNTHSEYSGAVTPTACPLEMQTSAVQVCKCTALRGPQGCMKDLSVKCRGKIEEETKSRGMEL